MQLHAALELIVNLALLVALTVVSGFVDKRWPRGTRAGSLLQGSLFGAVAVIGMLRPLNLGPGLIFDGRSVMLGLCATYFGPLAAAIAVVFVGVTRLAVSGAGTVTGILVAFASAAIGVVAHYRLQVGKHAPSSLHLLALGIAIHVVMVALMFTLPGGAGWMVVQRIGLPIIVAYPLATILAGKILSDQVESRRTWTLLQESEAKHRVLVEESPDPTFAFTPEGRYTYVNPAFANGVGKSVDEIVGRTMWDVFPKDEADKRFAGLSKAFHTGETNVIEVRVPRPDGDRYYVTTITPIRGAGSHGAPTSAICSSKDITERKRAEEALKESEARFRLFAEMAPVGIVISDRKEQTLYASPKFVDMFGYTLADMPSVKEWWHLAYPHADLRNRAQREWAEFVASTQQGSIPRRPLEFPVTCKDGTVRPTEFYLGSLGQLNVVVFVDVSARQQAEAEQARSHELLENLGRLVPGAIYQFRLWPDRRATFPWSTPGIDAMFGITPEQARDDAMPVLERVHPEDRQRVAGAIAESARTLQSFRAEFRVEQPGTGVQWRWAEAHPQRTPDGGTLWHGIVVDVTDRKTAEQERTRLEDQLRQALKMEAIGRLAGGVAHDFNNLLTGITGNAQLALLDVAPSDPIAESLTEIDKAAASAAALTRQLLAFSRKQLVEPRVLDLNELVSAMQKMLRRVIGEDIELETLPGQDIGAVKVDPGQVEQVLVNLAVNARDAMPDGGKVTIETANVELDAEACRAHADARPGLYVMLSVRDTGIGMSDDVRQHIFEPFFTTKPKGRGTGLGLATIYGAVTQAGGFIIVETAPRRGSTFQIYFPRVAEAAERMRQSSNTLKELGGSETILLVEDEASVLDTAIRILTRLGYRVLPARDGLQAISVAEQHAVPICSCRTPTIQDQPLETGHGVRSNGAGRRMGRCDQRRSGDIRQSSVARRLRLAPRTDRTERPPSSAYRRAR